MSKSNIKTFTILSLEIPTFKSYSVDEILGAGGTTAFANKIGKTPEKLIERLQSLPPDAFLTDEEYEEAVKTLKDSK